MGCWACGEEKVRGTVRPDKDHTREENCRLRKAPRTLKDLAKEAIAVQDACNLSGVVISFAAAMRDLCDLVPNTGERNRHPIAVLWADKVASLVGIQNLGDDRVMNAYREVYRLADGE